MDIRHVGVDKLTQFSLSELTSRETRIREFLHMYEDDLEYLQKELGETQSVLSFIQDELKYVKLAIRLKDGDLVRVICPSCKGSGMKPTDVTTGRVVTTKRTAFESLGKQMNPERDPQLQCPECKGDKWILMERYQG